MTPNELPQVVAEIANVIEDQIKAGLISAPVWHRLHSIPDELRTALSTLTAQGGDADRSAVMQKAEFRAACYALYELVEGYPIHRWVNAGGLRLKDTHAWASFANRVNDMRHRGGPDAITTPPAPSVLTDALKALRGFLGEFGDKATNANVRLARDVIAKAKTIELAPSSSAVEGLVWSIVRSYIQPAAREKVQQQIAEALASTAASGGDDNELPGMWSHSDFTGGDPDERCYAERERARTVAPAMPDGSSERMRLLRKFMAAGDLTSEEQREFHAMLAAASAQGDGDG